MYKKPSLESSETPGPNKGHTVPKRLRRNIRWYWSAVTKITRKSFRW